MHNVAHLIVEHLRAIRTDVSAVKDDVRELKSRISGLEQGQGATLQHLGHVATMLAAQQLGTDRLGDRIARLERRLDLSGRH